MYASVPVQFRAMAGIAQFVEGLPIFQATQEESMTWGEFKKWVEENKVKDEDEIQFIDFSYDPDTVAFSSEHGFKGVMIS